MAVSFTVGTVVRSFPHTKTIICLINGVEQECAPAFGYDGISMFGTIDASLPPEAATVLIATNTTTLEHYVLAVLPKGLGISGSGELSENDIDSGNRAEIFEEPGIDYCSLQAYKSLASDPKSSSNENFNNGQPANIFPGNYVKANHFGVLIGLLSFFATLRAGHKACIDVSLLDDLVQITSGYLRIFNDAFKFIACQDYGLSLLEFNFYSSIKSSKASLQENKDISPDKAAVLLNDTSEVSRFKFMLGALSDLFQLYITDKEDDSKARASLYAAGDGRIEVKSVNDISFEIGGPIPAPKRLANPEDPEGDSGESIVDENMKAVEAKEAFEFSGNGRSRNLEDIDAEAVNNHNKYKAFDTLGKDFEVPDENELSPFNEPEYDELGNKTVKQQQNRRAGVKVLKEGGIALYDNYGAEIILSNGDIVFNCPGRIILNAGKDVVALAGNDIINKAANNIEVTSDKESIYIAANKQLHFYSKKQGILMQTDSEGGVNFEGEGAEQQQSSGIILKAKASTILLAADNIIAKAVSRFTVWCDKMLTLVAGTLIGLADTILNMAGGSSISILDRSAKVDVADSIVSAGASSNAIFKGGEILIPFKWLGIGANIAGQIRNTLSKQYDTLKTQQQVLEPFKQAEIDKILFKFRKDRRLNTINPDGSGEMVIFEPLWQFLKRNNYKFLESYSTEQYSNNLEANGTKAWPGDDTNVKVKFYSGGSNYDFANNVIKDRLDPEIKKAIFEDKTFKDLLKFQS